MTLKIEGFRRMPFGFVQGLILKTIAMSKRLRVALHMSHLPIPQKINKARLISGSIAEHPSVFINAAPLLAELNTTIIELEAAYLAASDGGKSLTAIMHQKEWELIEVMREVGAYVEATARRDVTIVYLAALQVWGSTANHPRPEFEVEADQDHHSIRLRTRAQPRTFYRWQHSSEPDEPQNWITALTSHVSSVVVRGLAPGYYWFRVVLVSPGGEYPLKALRVGLG
jgi:hypothetical protein